MTCDQCHGTRMILVYQDEKEEWWELCPRCLGQGTVCCDGDAPEGGTVYSERQE